MVASPVLIQEARSVPRSATKASLGRPAAETNLCCNEDEFGNPSACHMGWRKGLHIP